MHKIKANVQKYMQSGASSTNVQEKEGMTGILVGMVDHQTFI